MRKKLVDFHVRANWERRMTVSQRGQTVWMAVNGRTGMAKEQVVVALVRDT